MTALRLTSSIVASTLMLAAAARSAYADMLPPTPASVARIDGDHVTTTTSLPRGAFVDIRLSASFGSGFSWVFESVPQSPLTFLSSHNEHPSDTPPDFTGGPDIQVFSFRADATGSVTLVFDYRRPWLKSELPKESRRITVAVTQ